MWFRAFQSSWTTSMWPSSRRLAAGSKDAVIRARMRTLPFSGSGGQQRLGEADEMTLDLDAQWHRDDAAAEDALIRGAVEHVDQQDRVRGQHAETELRLRQPPAALAHPFAEHGPRGAEHVAVDPERDVRFEQPAHEQLRHGRVVAE